VLRDSIVRALKGSDNPRSAKELAKAFARICTQRMARLWSRANPTSITIRAARPDDRERIVKAFRALDAESIRQRFFVPKKALSGEELRRLTESDGVRDVVLVATVARVDQEIIVGLGRYARNGSTAEIAFTVEEDYQRRGIARELLRQLTDIARRSGVLRFEADVLPDNAPMLKVFRRSGLPMKKTQADGIVHLSLSLDDGPGSA
jgi:RimJ/RimL family protein N-acetyltransferase